MIYGSKLLIRYIFRSYIIDQMSDVDEKIDIDQPLWDQSSYIGRWKHFVFITDSRTIVVPEKDLRKAKQFCDDYKIHNIPPDIQMADVIRAKQLRDSAFHPDTDDLIPILGRMSFQLPISVLLTSAMLTFYKSDTAVVLCQIANQTHAAILNYTNRNVLADGNDNNGVKGAFVCAVIASSVMAIGCRRILRQKGPIMKRFVPFCAVTVGHVVNLPLVRYKEIAKGIPLYIVDEEEPVMKSRVAAVKGISECIFTRIVMSIPCLLFIPIISQYIKTYCFYQRLPWTKFPIEMFLCAVSCMFAIPSALAIFPQCNSMNPELMKLYPPEYEEFKRNMKEYMDKVYYNKGL